MTWAIAWELLKRFWWAVPMAGLAMALAISHADATHYHKLADQNAATAQLANGKLAISNASIDSLTAALNAKNAESEARAKAYDDAKAQDAAAVAALDKQYSATKGQVESLKAIAAAAAKNPSCKVPTALLGQLEGL